MKKKCLKSERRLRSSTTHYLHFGLENPRDYRVLFMGAAENLESDGHNEQNEKGSKPHATFQFLIDRVRECMDAGILRDGDAGEVSVVIWAHLHGLVSLRLAGQLARVGSATEFGRLYHRSTEQLIAGLAR